MKDTSPEIAELVYQKLMARTPAERFIMGSRMFDAARAVALASFPPNLSELETKRRLFERIYAQQAPF
jgi:hypothetical protein